MIGRRLHALWSINKSSLFAGSKPLALAGKLALLALVGVFLLLGLIGLVLPVIPGILFLGLAALLLSRLSSRFAGRLRAHPHYRRWHSMQQASAGLSLAQRCKLGLLLACRGIVQGLDKLSARLSAR